MDASGSYKYASRCCVFGQKGIRENIIAGIGFEKLILIVICPTKSIHNDYESYRDRSLELFIY